MVEKESHKYECGWCGNKFEQEVGTSGGERHSRVSDQVQCRKCGNYLRTY